MAYCANCGERLTPSSLVQPASKIRDEEFAAFIGNIKKQEKLL